jgi:glycosyltransferase involved in cell wall biosynthesis
MIRQAALVICNSEAECSLIRRDFGDRPTKVVLPGVESGVALESAGEPNANGTTVLAGGRLEEYKQVEVVVRAVERLPATFRLVVFGEGPALEQITATATRTGVHERVDFVGRLSDADLAQRFRTANVFVSMSRKEAFGLTVLEAASAGTAVVSSDIPAYRELASRLPDGALRLVDVDAGPDLVADAINAAAAAPRPIAPLRSALPSWEAMTSGVLEGYRGVLAARGRLQPEGLR